MAVTQKLMRILKNQALFRFVKAKTIILLKKKLKNYETSCTSLIKN